MNKLSYDKIALIGLFGAVSVVLGVIENFLPLPLPGVRLGLANLGVMLMVYIGGLVPGLMVMILKMTLVPLMSGALLFRLSLSIPSGLAAFVGIAVCALVLPRYLSPVSAGVAGAMLHMITQLFVIDRLYIRGLFSSSFVGWFMLAAVLTGIMTGLITSVTLKKLPNVLLKRFKDKNKLQR